MKIDIKIIETDDDYQSCLFIRKQVFIIGQNIPVEIELDDDKINAANHMNSCIKILNEEHSHISESDLYKTRLIGIQTSPITTIQDSDSSMLRSKQLTTHPNFAAYIVELFHESELSNGDTIAVSMTGSFPGANLALLSACEVMNIKPIIISSVGSSSWGANREELSWLDMELYLYDKGGIHFKSLASSIGGKDDLGSQISEKGVENIEEIIGSKNIELVNKENLELNISRKIEIYNNHKKVSDYKAYINIGGGVASIGPGDGKKSLKAGIISPLEKNKIQYEGFSNSMAKIFLDKGVTFINIKNINLLAKSAGLYPPDKSIKINEGSLFYLEKNITVFLLIRNETSLST